MLDPTGGVIAKAEEETCLNGLTTYRIKVCHGRDQRVIATFTGTVFRTGDAHE